MATRNNSYKYANRIAKDVSKSISAVTFILCIVFLIVGCVIGLIISKSLSKNDIFCLNGQVDIVIVASEHEGDEYCYSDEGVKAISFGKDISNTATVTSSLKTNSNGEYIVPLDKSGTYTITYSVSSFKSSLFSLVSGSELCLVRTITVEA